jgi:arylsulfatase
MIPFFFSGSLLLSSALATSPNFLILFPDQWRYDWNPEDLPQLAMPTYTSLRAQSTRFLKAFVPAPLCAPSRACLAGGREYDMAGVPDNFSNDYPIKQETFYSILSSNGYEVMTAGKDDLAKASGPGINGSYHARELGFTSWARACGKDDVLGSAPHDPYGQFCSTKNILVNGSEESLWTLYKTDMNSCAPVGGNPGGGYDCKTPSLFPQEFYEDNWVADNAVALLKAKPANKPWFLQVSFPGPHPPFVVTRPMQNTTADTVFPLAVDNTETTPAVQQTLRRDYAAELLNLDGLFQRVLDAIPAEDLPNTFIFCASDHGEML